MKKGCVFCDNKNFDKALEIHPLIKEQTWFYSVKWMLFPSEGFAWWLEVLLRLCTEARFKMILISTVVFLLVFEFQISHTGITCELRKAFHVCPSSPNIKGLKKFCLFLSTL